MANWQAIAPDANPQPRDRCLVLQRDKTDAGDVPTLHGGDTFYGSLPDGDPFGGTVMETARGPGGSSRVKPEAVSSAQGPQPATRPTTMSRSSSRTEYWVIGLSCFIGPSSAAQRGGRGRDPLRKQWGRLRWCLPRASMVGWRKALLAHLTPSPPYAAGPSPLPPLRGRRGVFKTAEEIA